MVCASHRQGWRYRFRQMTPYRGYKIKYRRVVHSYEVFSPKDEFLGLFKTRVETERVVDHEISLTDQKNN